MTHPTDTPGPPSRSRTPLRDLRAAGMPSAGTQYVAELALQEAVGAEILRLRTAANLTQTGLAARAGVPLATVRRYEHGSAAGAVYLIPLGAIANALGTTLVGLFGGPTTSTGSDRPARVLLPVTPTGDAPKKPVWRLVEYTPRRIGQRPEPVQHVEPGRTVPGQVLTWASRLLGEPTELLSPASDLTGRRSWYVGPVSRPTPNRT